MKSKVLVAYFSASGVTARAAKEIAAATGGELFEIAPALPYSRADLDWTDKNSRSSVEMNDEGCRPAMKSAPPDISGFDRIFIGFPIWWYVEPRIIDTFLESLDLKGKEVVAFATSGGSGIAGAERRMKALCPAAKWQKGKLVNRGAGEWAASLER